MQGCTGYLYKQGGERKNWKKRWFVLRGNCLSYYENAESSSPIKSVVLSGYDVHEVPYDRFKKKLCFELFHPQDRTFYLYSEQVDEHDSWMSVLALATLPMNWTGRHRLDALRGSQETPFLPEEILQNAAKEVSELAGFERLRNVKSWQRRALLRKKMLLCSIHLPYRPSTAPGPDVETHEREKEAKRLALLELVDYCDNIRHGFNDAGIVCDVMNMIVCNICRALPSLDGAGDDDEEEETFMEPSWPHLSIVYELLLRIVQSNEIDLALKKKYIDTKFIIRLLDLFDSYDYREREALKTITHRIYGKLTNRRALIRRAISNVFFTFVYETERHNGIAELLEILGSIINGFAVPVKQDHVKLLERALIPLHSCKAVRSYHPVLSYCMSQYVNKEQRFAVQIVEGILKCWPQGSSEKEMLFLNELEEVIEVLSPATFALIEEKLYDRIARCIRGEHFQVAERALHMWGNEILNQIAVEDEAHRRKILPIVFPALAAISKEGSGHWQQSVRDGAVFVLQRYEQHDSRFYATCQAQNDKQEATNKK
jgi:serine/threonine-protein phosphatase 2A regulatory subunit B'